MDVVHDAAFSAIEAAFAGFSGSSGSAGLMTAAGSAALPSPIRQTKPMPADSTPMVPIASNTGFGFVPMGAIATETADPADQKAKRGGSSKKVISTIAKKTVGSAKDANGGRGRKKRDLVKEAIRNLDEFRSAPSDNPGFYGTGYKATLAWMVRLDGDIEQRLPEISDEFEDWATSDHVDASTLSSNIGR
jgi:hypothetical protein